MCGERANQASDAVFADFDAGFYSGHFTHLVIGTCVSTIEREEESRTERISVAPRAQVCACMCASEPVAGECRASPGVDCTRIRSYRFSEESSLSVPMASDPVDWAQVFNQCPVCERAADQR